MKALSKQMMNKFSVHSKYKIISSIILCLLLSLFIFKSDVEPLDNYKTISVSVYWPGADLSSIRNEIGIDFETRLKALNRDQEIHSRVTDERLDIYYRVKNTANVAKTIDTIKEIIADLNIPTGAVISEPFRIDNQKTQTSILIYGTQDIDYLSKLAYQAQTSLLNAGFDEVTLNGDLTKKTTFTIGLLDLIQLNLDMNGLAQYVKNSLTDNSIIAAIDNQSANIINNQTKTNPQSELKPDVMSLNQMLNVDFGYVDNQVVYFYKNQRAIKIDITQYDANYIFNAIKLKKWIYQAESQLPNNIALSSLSSTDSVLIELILRLILAVMVSLLLVGIFLTFILKIKNSGFSGLAVFKIGSVISLLVLLGFQSINILTMYGLVFAFIFIVIKEVLFQLLTRTKNTIIFDALFTLLISLIVWMLIYVLSKDSNGIINDEYVRVYFVSFIALVFYYAYKLFCDQFVSLTKSHTKTLNKLTFGILKQYQTVLKFCILQWQYSVVLIGIIFSIVFLIVDDNVVQNPIDQHSNVIEFKIGLNEFVTAKEALIELSAMKDAVIEYDFSQMLQSIDDITYKLDDAVEPTVATMTLYLKSNLNKNITNESIYNGVIELFEANEFSVGAVNFNSNFYKNTTGHFAINVYANKVEELHMAMNYAVELLEGRNDFINVESNVSQDKLKYKLQLTEVANTLGVNIESINYQLSNLINGLTIQNADVNNDFNYIEVMLTNNISDNKMMFENLPIKITNGDFYPLSALVSIEYYHTYSQLNSKNGRLVGLITSDYLGYLDDTPLFEYLNDEVFQVVSSQFDVRFDIENNHSNKKSIMAFVISCVLIIFSLIKVRKINSQVNVSLIALSIVPVLAVPVYMIHHYFDSINEMSLLASLVLGYFVVMQMFGEFIKRIDFNYHSSKQLFTTVLSASVSVFYPITLMMLLVLSLYFPLYLSANRLFDWLDLFYQQFIFVLVFSFIYQIILLPILIFNVLNSSIKISDNNQV